MYVDLFSRQQKQLRWKNVKVGDVLRLENNEFITVSVTDYPAYVSLHCMLCCISRGRGNEGNLPH